MRSILTFLILAFATVTHAHFQLQYPPPRGPFVASAEPTFCDGYNTTAAIRTTFPLQGGFVSLKTGHPDWTAGVLASTAQNPTSFDNFTQLVPFFQVKEAQGQFCFNVNFPAAYTNGENITIQIVFDGDDGKLYQCSDLTLSSSFHIASNVTCSNSSTTSASTTWTGGTPTATKSSGATSLHVSAGIVVLSLSILGTVLNSL